MTKFMLFTVLLIAGVYAHGENAGRVDGENVPHSAVTCYRAQDAITIDGRIDEPCWQAVPSIELVNFDGAPARYRTEAKMLWDEEALYIAFICEDPDIYAPHEQRDDPLYDADVVEVFIMEQGLDLGHFIEYEVSPIGTILDIYNIKPYTGIRGWTSSGLEVATTVNGTVNRPDVEDEGYVVEMKIPWADLSLRGGEAPSHGDQIRLNLYRIDYETPQEIGERGKNPGFITWSPTLQPGFHQPDRFGTVTFSELPAGAQPEAQGEEQEAQEATR